MKYTITTKDGLSFRTTSSEYDRMLSTFQRTGFIEVDGNSISRADEPKFRKIEETGDLPSLAEAVFNQSLEERNFKLTILKLSAKRIAEKGRDGLINYSLVKYVQKILGTWDAFEVWEHCIKYLDDLADKNIPPVKVPVYMEDVTTEAARIAVFGTPRPSGQRIVGYTWIQKQWE